MQKRTVSVAGVGRRPLARMPALLLCLALGLALLSGCETEDHAAPAATGQIKPPAECKLDADCPAPADTCQTAVCTAGVCLAKAKAAGAACDDHNLCNGTQDTCGASGCSGAGTLACKDDDPCTNDACDPAQGCVFTAKPTECDDANPCTQDGCTPMVGCFHTAQDQGACDDGDPCTAGDACAKGKCVSGPAATCEDGNPCTSDWCEPGEGCTAKNNTAGCDDLDVCTKGDACQDGKCWPGKTAVSCDDGKVCTLDSCDSKLGCQSKPLSDKPCDDGSTCTDADSCVLGVCEAGSAIDCSDGDPCTDDACDPAKGCAHGPASGTCDDGDACTTGDTCADGKCASTAATNCSDGNACTTDTCDPKTGCDMSLGVTACDDGNACTQNDACMGGGCQAGTAVQCDDLNPCTNDSCDPALGCVHTNNSVGCDDGKADTSGDICAAGVCAGTPAAKVVAVKTTASFTFDTPEVTLKVGDSVEFTTAAIHNVQEVAQATWDSNGSTALSGGFSVGFGETKKVTFTKAGTFWYVCVPHASMGMKGKVIVQ